MGEPKRGEVTAAEALAVLSKEARKALRESGLWQQEFNGSEIVAVIAMFQASQKVVGEKQEALSKAIAFIGSLHDTAHWSGAEKALEEINQALVSETIDQSIARQDARVKH